MSKQLNLSVWRNGRVEITQTVHAEAICVAEGTREQLESCLVTGCRLMKDNKRYLVNGIPEARTDKEAENALEIFKLICTNRIEGRKAFEGVTEMKARHEDEAIDDLFDRSNGDLMAGR